MSQYQELPIKLTEPTGPLRRSLERLEKTIVEQNKVDPAALTEIQKPIKHTSAWIAWTLLGIGGLALILSIINNRKRKRQKMKED